MYSKVLEGYEFIRPLEEIEKKSIKLYSDILVIRKYRDIFNMLEITGEESEKKELVARNAFHTLKEMVLTE